MKGVRILVGFVGLGWLLAGTGAGLSALEAGSQGEAMVQREWERTSARYDGQLKMASAELERVRTRYDARLQKAKTQVSDWEAKVAEAPENERSKKRLEDAQGVLGEEQTKHDDAVAAAQGEVDGLLKEKQAALAATSAPRGEGGGLWAKLGPFLGALFGLVLLLGAALLGLMKPAESAPWAPPQTDPNNAIPKAGV